jgi:hypothetical protein
MLLFCLMGTAAAAQNATFVMEPSVARADSLYALWNSRLPGQKGYRVQLYNGSRKEAQTVKTQFSTAFPQLNTYLTYQSPEYKVQVGDCRNEWEAERLRNDILSAYPAAIVVKAEIQMPKSK